MSGPLFRCQTHAPQFPSFEFSGAAPFSTPPVATPLSAVIDDSRAHVAADSSSGHQRHLPPLLVIIARCINFLLNLYTLPGPQTPQFAGNINKKEPK